MAQSVARSEGEATTARRPCLFWGAEGESDIEVACRNGEYNWFISTLEKRCPTGWIGQPVPLTNPFKASASRWRSGRGGLLFVNPALCSMLRPTKSETRGKCCFDFFLLRGGRRAIGGDLSIDSTCQQGTTIRARVPLQVLEQSAARAGE